MNIIIIIIVIIVKITVYWETLSQKKMQCNCAIYPVQMLGCVHV